MSGVLAELRRAEGAYRRAAERAEQRRQERDRLLAEALDKHSQTEVAQALGVTRGRVGQLATRLRRAADRVEA